MIRTRLRYHRPSSPTEASATLAEHAGNVAVLGGGTQLLPLMNRDEVHVEHLVDLRDLALGNIDVREDRVVVGALVSYADVLAAEVLRHTVPLLPRVAEGITGGRQLTQQATLVGAACHNYPGTDMPGALVALDARLRVHGTLGIREVAAGDFFLGATRVDLRPGEFVLSFAVPRAARAGYHKVKHSSGSWPIATATALPRADRPGITLTLGAVGPVPVRVHLEHPGELPDRVRDAITDPWSDVLAPGDYRAAIAPVVAARALAELQETQT